MAKQDFEANGRKYVNGGRKILNGRRVREWAEYVKDDGFWFLNTIRYLPISATRAAIANDFDWRSKA